MYSISLEQLTGAMRHLDAHGHAVEAHDVALARPDAAEEVADATALPARLPGEREPFELSILVFGIEDDQIVTVAVAREVAVDDLRTQDVLVAAPRLQLLEDGMDHLGEVRFVRFGGHGSLA